MEVLKLTSGYGELVGCLDENKDCRDGIGKRLIETVLSAECETFL